MISIENTGERILLDKESALMIARHMRAYRFAKEYIYSRRILDIGCGEGYGTHYLAEFAKDIMGIDYDLAVIDYAKSKYQRINLKYAAIDIKDLNNINDKFDVICCFQVIEHILDPVGFLSNVNNLLEDGSIFLCSTPNKLDASPGSDIPLNQFHVREYLYKDFKELLSTVFKGVEIFGLQRSNELNFYRRIKKIGIFKYLPESIDPVRQFYKKIKSSHFNVSTAYIESALDFIAVCKK